MIKIGRNDPCLCGSGEKFKKCCQPKFSIIMDNSQHSKRMHDISKVAIPPPGTKEYEEYRKYFDKNIEPNIDKNRAKKLFEVASSNVMGIILNGADLLCDQNLRYFYKEYNDRLFSHGLWSFPTSFNVGEAFMNYIPSLNYFDLKQEKDYLFSFEDYMEYVTSENCNEKYKEAINYFEEGIVYNYNNTDDLKKFTLKTKDNSEYVFGGVSLIRHQDELNIIMTIGQIIDTKEKDIEIQRGYKWEMSKNPAKKDLKPDSSWKLEAVRLNGIENIWHQVVMSRYDFSDFTQNVRLILEDKGQSFTIFTDDVSVFANAYGSLVDHGSKEILISMSKILEQKSTLFELSKFMIFLPNYFTQNEEKIIIERHPTQLIKYLKEGEDKEFEQLVDNKKLIRYRNVYSFVNSTKIYPDIIISKAPGLKIEMTGFWKKLNPNQIGINKKGEPIHGKTWVEQKLTWLETDEEEVVKLYGKHGKDILSGENEGVIYVMRCAAHSKDIFKIGLTKRSSEIRSSELERTTGSPDKFLVVEEWYVSDCYRAEKEIHEKLVRFRFNPNREFFQAPYDILRKELYEIIEKYKKNYPN